MKKFFLFILQLFVLSLASAQSVAIDAYIDSVMLDRNIPGLQLAIVKDGSIVKTGAYGIANIEDDIPVDSNTLFAINSMTKTFTGVAVMQLVEEGKVRLDAPVGEYLEELPDAWKKITIRQLMSHTSGLPNMMSPMAELLATWEEVQQLPVKFAPGTDFDYNQTNYAIIGKLINTISGSNFETFIQQGQLKAVSAERTIEAGFGHYDEVIPHSARGYTYFKTGSLTHVYEYFPPECRTAAGMSATATEMARWYIALQKGKLISLKSLTELWAPAVLDNGQTKAFGRTLNGYAIGTPVMVNAEGGNVIATIGGARSAALTYLDKGITIVVLTNLQGAFPERFIPGILELL